MTPAQPRRTIAAGEPDGEGHYSVPTLTEHLETNLWLAETILGADVQVSDHCVRIEGVGFALA